MDRYLKILVQDLNEHVAISEEFAIDVNDPSRSGGLQYDRKVTRTISQGTLIDEGFMDPYENNYLLAIGFPSSIEPEQPPSDAAVPIELKDAGFPQSLLSEMVGLAWLDLSTGDFFTQSTNLGSLSSVAARIGAREIVMLDERPTRIISSAVSMLEQQRSIVTNHDTNLKGASIDDWAPMIENEIPSSAKLAFTDQEICAGSLLLSYVRERLPGSGIRLQAPIRRQDQETMSIDKNSMRALEVLGTSKEGLGGGKGSLLHTMRRTVTKSGARLLRAWIASPSMSLGIINNRLDLVSQFLHNPVFKEEVIELLKSSYDSQRLVQKFSMGKGDADDLIDLLKTIEITSDIASVIKKSIMSADHDGGGGIQSMSQRDSLLGLSERLSLNGPIALADEIRISIDEDNLIESHSLEEDRDADLLTPAQQVLQSEGSAEDHVASPSVTKSKLKLKAPTDTDTDAQEPWILRRTASDVLQVLHDVLDGLQLEKAALAKTLQNELRAQSLTLRWTPGLGHICHVKGTRDVASSLKEFSATRDVRTTKSTRSFHHSEWRHLGGRIEQAKVRIKAEELRVLQDLRGKVVANQQTLRRNATVLDELDIACSFAILAEEQCFVRPALNNGLNHNIVGGRHPTVKVGLEEQGRAFVSNDCRIGEKERIWLITGPNMAGKSTFLRQNALISIMAQTGSFVPAEHAEIGLVDQIFTRVGSADNLFKDQSTFMVEMMETAAILNHATPQSFVIMDEIGRGTTPEDGIAVGFACLHHLYHKNRCRTLFATHFHSLADMTKDFEHLGCYCTDIAEGAGDSFSFIHRLRPGVNRSSHALKVAALAGVPQAAIQTARTVLQSFEDGLPP